MVKDRENKLKKTIITLLCFLVINFCSAQIVDSTNANVSLSRAINIAKKKGYYRPTNESVLPFVTFDKANQDWQIVSTNYKHYNKGKCKRTNGCTIVTKLLITIDADNGKILKKSKEKEIFNNYE
jgi:hypothetical protein